MWTWVGITITSLLGGGGLVGLLKSRAESAKASADAEQARGQAANLLQQAEEVARKADLASQEYYRGVITDQSERLRTQDLRLDEMQARLNGLAQQVSDLTREVAVVSDRAQRAESEVTRLHDWIDSGMAPPPPTRPLWLTPRRKET
jgi:DNA repair exonuclease SbcCD ATPase subunit